VIEMTNVRQVPGDYFRRWFADENFDLIAWYEAGSNLYGFQLTYDKGGEEKTVTWFGNGAVSHHQVDSGEDDPLANRTPILIQADGQSNMRQVLSDFKASGKGIPLKLRSIVRAKLREYGRLPTPLTERVIRLLFLIASGALVFLALSSRIRHERK
jgi:hypothetical protein